MQSKQVNVTMHSKPNWNPSEYRFIRNVIKTPFTIAKIKRPKLDITGPLVYL